MPKFEKNFIEWLEKNAVIILLAIVSIVSVVIRVTLYPYVSNDMSVFMLPWFDEMQGLGGYTAIKTQIGDYGMPYQIAFKLLTYINGEPINLIKTFHLLFDYSLAFACLMLVNELKAQAIGEKLRKISLEAAIAYILVLISPIVITNSALWGQCDSMFTSFIVWSLYFYLKDKRVLTFLFYGFAFAFKLQAVFLLPFYIYAYVKRKDFSFLHLLLTLVGMYIPNLPGIILRGDFFAPFKLYASQTGTYAKYVTLNFPGVLGLWAEGHRAENEMITAAWSMLAVLAIGVFFLALIKTKKTLEKQEIIEYAFLFTYFAVLVMPSMHERYGYPYEILSILVAIRNKKTIPLCVLLHAIAMLIYGRYLNGVNASLPLLSVLNITVFVIYAFIILKDKKETDDKVEDEN